MTNFALSILNDLCYPMHDKIANSKTGATILFRYLRSKIAIDTITEISNPPIANCTLFVGFFGHGGIFSCDCRLPGGGNPIGGDECSTHHILQVRR